MATIKTSYKVSYTMEYGFRVSLKKEECASLSEALKLAREIGDYGAVCVSVTIETIKENKHDYIINKVVYDFNLDGTIRVNRKYTYFGNQCKNTDKVYDFFNNSFKNCNGLFARW